jgi:hypothetical protein
LSGANYPDQRVLPQTWLLPCCPTEDVTGSRRQMIGDSAESKPLSQFGTSLP